MQVEAINWDQALVSIDPSRHLEEVSKSKPILEKIAARAQGLAISDLEELGVPAVLKSFGAHYFGSEELHPVQAGVTDGSNEIWYTSGFRVESKFPWPVSYFSYEVSEAAVAVAILYEEGRRSWPASLNIYGMVDSAINRMLICEGNGHNLYLEANSKLEKECSNRSIQKGHLILEDPDNFSSASNVKEELVVRLSEIVGQWQEWGIVPKDLAKLGEVRIAKYKNTPPWQRFLIGKKKILSGGRA